MVVGSSINAADSKNEKFSEKLKFLEIKYINTKDENPIIKYMN